MGKELIMQSKCTQWAWNTYPEHRGRLRRIKNELDNHPRKSKMDIIKQLSENKATGVVPGDSDLYFIDRIITYIELKIPIDGRQSLEQKKFQQLVESCGHRYRIIRTLQEFQDLYKSLIHDIQEK
jgi:hypothetical protein